MPAARVWWASGSGFGDVARTGRVKNLPGTQHSGNIVLKFFLFFFLGVSTGGLEFVVLLSQLSLPAQAVECGLLPDT